MTMKHTVDSILENVQKKPKTAKPAQPANNMPRKTCEFCRSRMKYEIGGQNPSYIRRIWSCPVCGSGLYERVYYPKKDLKEINK